MPKSNSWRGQDWSSDLPLWHVEHPLFQAVGKALLPETVRTQWGETEVAVPDIDEELRPIVAAFAVAFTAPFYKAQRIMPTIALEAVALLYCNLGATDEAWREFLDKLGVKIAPQSRNLFISFLRWVCGNAPDKSNRLGKMAKALAAWVAIYKPGPATLGDEKSEDWGSPDPIYSDEHGPGTSDFAKWLRVSGGYSRTAATYTEETDEIANEDELLLPAEADELSGFPDLTALVVQHYVREEKCTVALIGITSDRGELVGDQVPPDDPRAKGWMVLLHHPNRSSAVYADLIWRDRAAAEAFIHEAASYSESTVEPPYPESITEPPASDPTEQSGDGSPESPPAEPSLPQNRPGTVLAPSSSPNASRAKESHPRETRYQTGVKTRKPMAWLCSPEIPIRRLRSPMQFFRPSPSRKPATTRSKPPIVCQAVRALSRRRSRRESG